MPTPNRGTGFVVPEDVPIDLHLRPAGAADAQRCGQICYEAFAAIAGRHGYPPDFPSPDIAAGMLDSMIQHPNIYGVVAEGDGEILGSNFLDERNPVAGIGPITVAPEVQDGRIGRALMNDVMVRAAERQTPGVRLVQAAYHTRSLALYAKLGFDTRETLSNFQGAPLGTTVPGYDVRPATPADVDACNALARRAHGHDRAGELQDAVEAGTATVVEHRGRIAGYATAMAFFGHAVAESNAPLEALIAAAPEFGGPGILVPTRNAELVRWCLANGLRIVQQMTLMTVGLYNEPTTPYLPSVFY